MNQDKAREFFSAYYEDALEGGLKQSLETQLKTDATLQADYVAFVETMRDLDALKHEEIEIPIYLSDRIASRLEQVQTKPKFGLPLWTTWMRGAAFAGLAVVAITAALPMFNSGGATANGGFGGPGTADQLLFKVDGSNVVLDYAPTSPKTVIVTSPVTGKELRRFDLNGQRLESPIENSNQKPAVFKVEVVGDKTPSIVVVPGKATTNTKAGDGTVQDLAVSIAGRYHVPVVIEAADVQHHVTWTFGSGDANTAASQALENEGFSVDQRSDGLIKIR